MIKQRITREDYKSKLNPLTIKKEVNISFDKEEQFKLMVQFAKAYPDIVQSILNNNGKISCSFPFKCQEFPCEKLWCNYDVCDNGYCYRMS